MYLDHNKGNCLSDQINVIIHIAGMLNSSTPVEMTAILRMIFTDAGERKDLYFD